MFTLILDTSTERGLLLIAEKKKVLFEKKLLLNQGQGSSLLMQSLLEGFKELAITPRNLKAIGIASGPGRFTGIRVSKALAQGLGAPFALPILEFSSLKGFVSQEEGEFFSYIDGKITGGHILARKREGKNVYDLGPPQILPQGMIGKFLLENRVVSPSLEGVFPDSSFLAAFVEECLT